MKTKTLIPFLALTFGLTWGIAALLIFFTDQVAVIFGELSSSNPRRTSPAANARDRRT